MKQNSHIVPFKDIDKHDVEIVGGKGANLGEMVKAGFPVPDGFVITSKAYFDVLDANNLRPKIKALLQNLDHHDPRSLNAVSAKVKKLVYHAQIPNLLALDIIKAYLKLGKQSNKTLVAVRSSATAEDLPGASFAGQQDTFLNVSGEANLIQSVRGCWASLFEPRAIFYRQEKKFDHFKVGIAVPVQRMVQSTVAGVMFTVNPITNDKNQVMIEAIWGLGEKIVQGAYTPDHYLVQKLTWKLLQKQVSPQEREMILKGNKNAEPKIKKSRQNAPKLSDEQIITLAKLGHQIQQHYFFPQDIEWAMEKNQLYIVQSRPITTIKTNDQTTQSNISSQGLKLIIKGDSASPGMASGYTRLLKSAKEIDRLKAGEILITDMTTPDFVPAMKKAAAIVTNKGGQTSHAAIVSRELGIPCVVGAAIATKLFKKPSVITVNGATGEVFSGANSKSNVKLEAPSTEIAKPSLTNKHVFAPDIKKTATKIYVNLGDPDLAEQIAVRNVDGVGLLRAEFMIAQMGTHPKKLIADGKKQQFIDGLVAGLTAFTKSFSPRPIVYRTTDFKTNEYVNLNGGKLYEPKEENPMLGYRGAFRYLADAKVFELELEAIKIVRNKLGYKNLWVMIPFVRSVNQLIAVKKIMAEKGLSRTPTFKLWMMVEIPSNVVLLEEYLKIGIDGVSIGSNDLTMLMLGVDRDSSDVASIYDERDPAVMWAFEKIIKTCSQHKVSCSMCGQAPSTYPDLTDKLVKWGITSVSVSPDVIDLTRQLVYQAEQKLAHGQR